MIGVGIIGAGPVTQAIHLPTLARMPELFTVRAIMDVSPEVVGPVAGRAGARAVTDLDDLLGDPQVEVVAICSPHRFHAEQVVAAIRHGKRAILCEKPLATTRADAHSVAEAAETGGTPVLVGAMHRFDPAWVAVSDAWGDLPLRAHTVRSSIVLPGNDRFEDWATELVARPGAGSPHERTPEVVAASVSAAVLGLAVHDVPLIRRFLPRFREVALESAAAPPPFGYVINAVAGDRRVQLFAAMLNFGEPRWEFDVVADDASLHVEFPPSYVHAGSAAAELTAGGVTRRFGPFAHNGHEAEWRALHAAATGAAIDLPPLAEVIDDLEFTVGLAESAAGHLLSLSAVRS